MPELPKDWGLTTKTGERGNCEVWGKDDAGKDYRVRACDTSGITEKDLKDLKAADREIYTSREQGIRQFVKGLTGEKRETDQIEKIRSFEDSDWIESAMPVVRAGMGNTSISFSHISKEKWDNIWRN